jgi:hypothetical protein
MQIFFALKSLSQKMIIPSMMLCAACGGHGEPWASLEVQRPVPARAVRTAVRRVGAAPAASQLSIAPPRALILTALVALLACTWGVPGFVPAAQAELIYDQYGNAFSKEKVCPWADNEGRCPICPVPYFPCWEEGVFCFRPIYCQGKFSPV